MTTTADLLAIRREYTLNGRDAAVAAIRQRSSMIDESGVEAILERILVAPIIHPRCAAHSGIR